MPSFFSRRGTVLFLFQCLRNAFFLPILFSLIASGCTSVAPITEESIRATAVWDYARNGINLEVTADAALNRYDDQAHSIVLAVLQLADMETVYQFTDDVIAMQQLLQFGKISSPILQAKRLVIEPDSQTVIRLARIQGAKHVVLVWAYYDVPLQKTTLFFDLPVHIEKSGFISKSYRATAVAANIRLYLGERELISASLSPITSSLPIDHPKNSASKNKIIFLDEVDTP